MNPYLLTQTIAPIHARIGIDRGTVLISRIGVPTGSAEHPRSFLTAVGATANIACRLQQSAGIDEILVGDQVATRISGDRRGYLTASPVTTTWNYLQTGAPYTIWRYSEVRTAPYSLFADYLARSWGPPQTQSAFGASLLALYAAASPAPAPTPGIASIMEAMLAPPKR